MLAGQKQKRKNKRQTPGRIKFPLLKLKVAAIILFFIYFYWRPTCSGCLYFYFSFYFRPHSFVSAFASAEN